MRATWQVLVLGGIAAASVLIFSMRTTSVPAIDFTDALTGPDSPHLDIPFDKYTLTPDGLLRAHSMSGRGNGIDRPMVRTRSADYLSRDFVFQADVTIPPDVQDITFVGLGAATPGPEFFEPSGAVLLRIHHLPGNDGVFFALREAGAGAGDYRYHERLGAYPRGGRLTVRLERVGDHVTASLPDQTATPLRIRLSAYPGAVLDDAAHLFFGSTAEGTTFSNISVRPAASAR